MIPVRHRWPVRLLRSIQFGLARMMSPDGCLEARAAPFDLVFRGPAADCITRHIYRYGSHEPHITRFVIDNVRLGPDDIAIDIGANLGWYSVLLNRLSAPGARILAFEPDPRSFRLLARNLDHNAASQVTPLNIALGERPGVAQLHRYRDSNNGRHTLLAGNCAGGLVRVPVATLSDVWALERLGSRPIRFLKVDVEGYEYFVLRGAGDLLGRCACALVEYSPEGMRLAGLEPQVLTQLLQGAGLRAEAFVRGRLVPISYAELAALDSQHDLVLRPESARSSAS